MSTASFKFKSSQVSDLAPTCPNSAAEFGQQEVERQKILSPQPALVPTVIWRLTSPYRGSLVAVGSGYWNAARLSSLQPTSSTPAVRQAADQAG